MSPRFESIELTRTDQSKATKDETTMPEREPNGSATALANQDHRPCGQAMTTLIQFSQPRPVFLSEKGYGYGSYNRVYYCAVEILRSRERDKSTR
eukprot:scaffold81924_cov54-Attheya_sp.AAC.4